MTECGGGRYKSEPRGGKTTSARFFCDMLGRGGGGQVITPSAKSEEKGGGV